MVRGTKRALLVGCKYYGTLHENDGCGNDVQIIHDLIKQKLYFNQENITILLESRSSESQNQPTMNNIENELRKMIDKAEEGDVLFFYFSGLGKLDDNSRSPAIVSCKFEPITAARLHSIINQDLPRNATFTFVCEASKSGKFLQGPIQLNDNRILLSSCQHDEIAHRNTDQSGIFTDAIRLAFTQLPPPVTITNLVANVTRSVESRKPQHPSLVCNGPNSNAPFLGFLIN